MLFLTYPSGIYLNLAGKTLLTHIYGIATVQIISHPLLLMST
ncbi:hypothetical protein yrohd0001_3940 [Yersinia rohdei ATCC 43380]|nr:hypothetical protein yrohd0001_3940 [Yersinia rohdei ATCC 43380]